MNTDKIVKFIEYIGPKEEKKAGGALFKANPDFDNRKVGIVDRETAEGLLRFPEVFKEFDVQKFVQGDLLVEKIPKSPEEFKEAMAEDRNRREQRHKKGKKR